MEKIKLFFKGIGLRLGDWALDNRKYIGWFLAGFALGAYFL